MEFSPGRCKLFGPRTCGGTRTYGEGGVATLRHRFTPVHDPRDEPRTLGMARPAAGNAEIV